MDQHDDDLYETAELEGISQFPDNEELTITRVERTKAGRRYRITFGMYSITVLEDVMIKYRMTRGNTFRRKISKRS